MSIELGVHFLPDSRVHDITENGVYVECRRELVFLKADTVVLAVGAKPENKLAEGPMNGGFTVYMIGDCVSARDAREAIREAAGVGRGI